MIDRLKQSTLPIIVAFSGGKDSVAMVLWLLENKIPKHRIHLHHHDVDGICHLPGPEKNIFDWECTQEYCRAFAKALGLEIFFSCRAGGIYSEIMRNEQPRGDVYYQLETDGVYFCRPSNHKRLNTRLMFPAVQADIRYRWCSATAKIDVLRTIVTVIPAYANGCFILTGERRSESTARSKYVEVEEYHSSNNSRPMLQMRLIIDWSEKQVWEIMRRWRIQPHPAYMLGWSRCSCKICIFSSSNIWATVNEIDPDRIEFIGETEEAIDHTLYHKKTIYQKVAEGTPLERDKEFAFWLQQSINFTVDIIVPKEIAWVLPKGAFSMEKSGSL